MPTLAVKQADRSEPATEHARFVGELFERERASLLKYLAGLLRNRADAEDALQETYVRLLQTSNLARESYARARSYAFRIATNLAYDSFRKRRDLGVVATLVGAEQGSTDDAGPQILAMEQSLEALKRALLTLETRCRRVFLLRVAEGLGYETIAAKLGISKRTAEREMKRAVDICQRELKGS